MAYTNRHTPAPTLRISRVNIRDMDERNAWTPVEVRRTKEWDTCDFKLDLFAECNQCEVGDDTPEMWVNILMEYTGEFPFSFVGMDIILRFKFLLVYNWENFLPLFFFSIYPSKMCYELSTSLIEVS